MERYSFDIAKQTLTMSAAFATEANNPESDEYRLVRQLMSDFPSLRIERKTHATPTHYKNGDGSVSKHNKNYRLTYERMERFILAMSPKDNTDYLEMFYEIRDKAEDMMCASPYDVVSKWFVKQFPKYRSNPMFYVDNQPDIIDIADVIEKAKKKSVKESA